MNGKYINAQSVYPQELNYISPALLFIFKFVITTRDLTRPVVRTSLTQSSTRSHPRASSLTTDTHLNQGCNKHVSS